jgi:hypothetical protein
MSPKLTNNGLGSLDEYGGGGEDGSRWSSITSCLLYGGGADGSVYLGVNSNSSAERGGNQTTHTRRHFVRRTDRVSHGDSPPSSSLPPVEGPATENTNSDNDSCYQNKATHHSTYQSCQSGW